MPLSKAEFLIRKQLPRRSSILLFDAACLSGWTTVAAIAELAGVSRRRAGLELAELVERGWLSAPETHGPQNQARRVRYTARVAGIAGDRAGRIADDPTGGIPGDRTAGIASDPAGAIVEDRTTPYGRERARVRATDPDRSSDLNRPSVLGGEGGTDGRTDGEQKFARVSGPLARSIADAWQLDAPIVHRVLGRFLSEAEVTERELQAYLRAALLHRERRRLHPAFADLEPNDPRWFGRACVAWRLEKWRADPKAQHGAPKRYRDFARDDAGELSAEERAGAAAAAARARDELKRREREYASEAQAIGAAVARQMRGGT